MTVRIKNIDSPSDETNTTERYWQNFLNTRLIRDLCMYEFMYKQFMYAYHLFV